MRKTRRRAAWLTPSKDDNAVLRKSDRKDCEVLMKDSINYLPIYGVLIVFQDFMPGDKILSDTTIWVGFETHLPPGRWAERCSPKPEVIFVPRN